MKFIYSAALQCYHLFISIASWTGSEKAKQWLAGRKNWEERLKPFSQSGNKRYWFHCSSLGEFEQGRPLIEAIRKKEPESGILLTFFSPSGYEIRKKYPVANVVMYLPEDSARNANRFIELVNPSKVFFIKYDYWYHYLSALHNKKIPVYVVSAIFRPSQLFFKWYGGFFRAMLSKITCFFVQDENSVKLLNEIGIKNVIVSGDTRFDRVAESAALSESLPLLENLSKNSMVLVAGSTWAPDEDLLIHLIKKQEHDNLKLIIAPHEVNATHLAELKKKLFANFQTEQVTFYSNPTISINTKILVVDIIGILGSAYRYGSFAYIGGGFGKGIHNILEAATFGIPILFGPNHSRFREAQELIRLGAASEVIDIETIEKQISKFMADENTRKHSGDSARNYVQKNTGATQRITEIIFKN